MSDIPVIFEFWRLPSRRSLLCALLLGLVALPHAAHSQGTPLFGGITADTVLTASKSPYLVKTLITVINGSTLTIQPGVELRFSPGTYLEINDDNRLIAEGTADAPIRFTSAQANPAPGDWRGFFFHPRSHARMVYCDVGYGGEANEHAMDVTNPDLLLQNSQIHDAAGIGIHMTNDGITPTFDGLTIARCGGPAITQDNPDKQTHYRNITMTGNHPDGIMMGGGGLDRNTTFELTGYPYYVTDIFETINRASLTFAAGTEFRFMPGTFLEINDDTQLIAEGTADRPIRFGSAQDNPQPGDWRGLFLHGRAKTSLAFCDIGYAGIENERSLVIMSSQTTLRQCRVHDGGNVGIRIDVSAFQPTLDGVTVENCKGPALLYTGIQIQPIYHNLSLSGNHPDGITSVGGEIRAPMAWDLVGYPYYFQGPVDTAQGATLTILPGVESRFMPGAFLEINDDSGLIAEGTAALPIRFLSSLVPSHPGDWRGLYFHTRSHASLAYSVIDNAGGANEGAVAVIGSDVNLRNSRIRQSAGSGIHLGNRGSAPTFQDVTIEGSVGPAIAQDDPDFPATYSRLTLIGNHPDGAVVGGGGIDRDVTFTLVGYPYFLLGTVGVTNGATLTLSPGAELRFGAGTYLEVYDGARLAALGTPGGPIRLTSGVKVPQPGDWRGIYLHQFGKLSLVNSEVAFAGAGGEPAVDDNTTDADIRNAWIHDCAGPAIRVNNNIHPTITLNRFENNGFGLTNLTPSTPVNAAFNWWGDANGPRHSTNPSALQGEPVGDGVLFTPWLTDREKSGLQSLPGDVNGDGAVDVRDVVVVLQISSGLIPAGSGTLLTGDLNGDGQINIQDALLLLRKTVLSG